jgi:hypothetical protein
MLPSVRDAGVDADVATPDPGDTLDPGDTADARSAGEDLLSRKRKTTSNNPPTNLSSLPSLSSLSSLSRK